MPEIEFGPSGVRVDGVLQEVAPVVGKTYRVIKDGPCVIHYFKRGDIVECVKDRREGRNSAFKRVTDGMEQWCEPECVEEIAAPVVIPQQPPEPLNAALLVALVRVVCAYDAFAACDDDADAAYEALGKAIGDARGVIDRATTEAR